MNKGSTEILGENLNSVNLSLKRLMYSYEACSKVDLNGAYSDDEFVIFEAMAARFARTTDILVNKVLRSIDVVEYIDVGTVIDAANNAEKRGLANAQNIRTLKDLRNSITHEYATERVMQFFDKVLEYTPMLIEIIKNVNKYCEKYVALESGKQ